MILLGRLRTMKSTISVTTFLTNASGEEHVIEVPLEGWRTAEDRNAQLAQVFYWGQNEFQWQKGKSSLSAGDYIFLPTGEVYEVRPLGFKRIALTDAMALLKELWE
jgi:hypothetical protein